jgi:hypothetical protein
METIILVVNFLFGLRVNEIPNKTFILDSHRPFICSVILRQTHLSNLSLKHENPLTERNEVVMSQGCQSLQRESNQQWRLP